MTLEETLISIQPTPGLRRFYIKPDDFTVDSIIAAMNTMQEGVTVIMVKPPFLIVEAEELDADIGNPIEDLGGFLSNTEDEIDTDSDDANEEKRGTGFEISEEDWNNILLLCNNNADQVADVDIDWLIEAGLAERSAGGNPRPTALALTWTKQT